jgi:hypothetical protein
VFGVAEELERRGVPVIFASGYARDEVFPAAFARHPRLCKPYSESDLLQVLEGIARRPPDA